MFSFLHPVVELVRVGHGCLQPQLSYTIFLLVEVFCSLPVILLLLQEAQMLSGLWLSPFSIFPVRFAILKRRH